MLSANQIALHNCEPVELEYYCYDIIKSLRYIISFYSS